MYYNLLLFEFLFSCVRWYYTYPVYMSDNIETIVSILMYMYIVETKTNVVMYLYTV